MAHSLTYEIGHGFGPSRALRRAFADYRLYRQTLAELGGAQQPRAQRPRHLALSIREIAHESVYGA